MQIISVINYKGGVGKTTVTANLAAKLASQGKKILLLDMDAQSSLTFSFITPDKWNNDLKLSHTIKKWFDCVSNGETPPAIHELSITPQEINTRIQKSSTTGKIDLVSSHLALINVDLELATLLGGANMSQTKKNYIKVHGRLRDALRTKHIQEYDIVLIDCPPNFNIVTKNALIASDKILVPAKPDYLSTLGIEYLHTSVDKLIKEFNEYAMIDRTTPTASPEFIGVVFTMIQIMSDKPISAQKQYIAQTKRINKMPVFDTYFRENKTIFSDAPQHGIPVSINSYPYGGTYHNIVNEIELFVDEFKNKVGI